MAQMGMRLIQIVDARDLPVECDAMWRRQRCDELVDRLGTESISVELGAQAARRRGHSVGFVREASRFAKLSRTAVDWPKRLLSIEVRPGNGGLLAGKEETAIMATTKSGVNGARRKAPRQRVPERAAAETGRLYAGLSASARRAERRERLMEAGLELFGTAGFRKTTIPMLCSASGVTARHFYEEFESRETLLRALYDRIAEEVFERVIAALRLTDRDVLERVRDSNAAYFRYLTSDPRLAQIYTIEAVGMHAELEAHRRTKREMFVKKLTKAAQRVESSSVDSRLLSAAIAGAAHDLLLEWVLAPRRPSVEKLIDTITTLWVRALGLDRERGASPSA
jgi:AcrR family transcriptional regulator